MVWAIIKAPILRTRMVEVLMVKEEFKGYGELELTVFRIQG